MPLPSTTGIPTGRGSSLVPRSQLSKYPHTFHYDGHVSPTGTHAPWRPHKAAPAPRTEPTRSSRPFPVHYSSESSSSAASDWAPPKSAAASKGSAGSCSASCRAWRRTHAQREAAVDAE
eukprot:GHVU01086765.1.p2 GENE.GHVU01086765.1~~GHVU01086765.1.p2  ORF type:complete len:119 (+),score=8.64 GHVU01086765.1:582-938(+)